MSASGHFRFARRFCVVMSDPHLSQPSEELAGPDEGAGGGESPQRPAMPKIIRFDTLARCGDEVWIENEGQIYRLRKTRQGKLILTK